MDELELYLDGVCRRMGGAKSLREHVRRELREHLLDAAGRYRSEGLSESAALARAIGDFGEPEEVRSELEATYGQRLMAVAIDKARQWKEMMLGARWLWSAWAHVALTGVIAVQFVLLGGGLIKVVPRYFRLLHKGWIDVRDYPSGAFLEWTEWGLNGAELIVDYAPFLLPPLALAWGLFEWRVRSANKSLMRLAVLASAASVLSVVSLLATATLLASTLLAVESMNGRAPEQIVRSELAELNASLAELDWWAKEHDREAIRRGASPEELSELHRVEELRLPAPVLDSAYDRAKGQTMRALADQAYAAISTLDDMGAAGSALASFNDQDRVKLIRTELRAARTSMEQVRWSLSTPSLQHRADRVAAALREFHEAYGRLQVAMTPEK